MTQENEQTPEHLEPSLEEALEPTKQIQLLLGPASKVQSNGHMPESIPSSTFYEISNLEVASMTPIYCQKNIHSQPKEEQWI